MKDHPPIDDSILSENENFKTTSEEIEKSLKDDVNSICEKIIR